MRVKQKAGAASLLLPIKKAWLPVFVVCSLAFLASYFVHAAQDLRHPLGFSLWFFIVTALVHVGYWVMATALWRDVVRITSSARLSRMQALAQLVMVALGKYMPGKVWGMLARGAQLAKHGATSGEAVFATYYEQYMLLHASVILCCVMVAFLSPPAWQIGSILAAASITFAGTKGRAVGIKALLYLLGKFRHGRQVRQKAIGASEYAELLAKFLFLWLLNSMVFIGLFLTFFDTGEITPRLLLVLVFANVAGVTLGFFAVFSPGGVGVREAVISGLVSSVMPLADAVLLSILYRVWVVLSELLAGLTVAAATRRPAGSKA